MKISVITLTYNSIKTIEETIKSVKAQTYKNIEKIWIDNISKDGTLEFLKKHQDNKTILLSEKDKGIVDAFNKGLKIATGDVIGFLHSDDKFYDRNTIKNIAEEFKNSKINVVYGDLNYVTKNNKIIEGWPGSWFESKEDKRRRLRREREEREEMTRRILMATCINPTPQNREICGANYYFPENHLEAGADAARNAFKNKMDSSKKPDTAKTSTLNKEIRTY